ncbi:hypothetical protein BGP_2825 [Beggiatoa sp. PS]|nr:hypothetical protein BGP_2825 [Beggiatoa sp. PS]
MSEEKENTFKFTTVLFIILGLMLPLWPITLPLFFWLAYRSYKKGVPERMPLSELKHAKDLLESGAITQEEYDTIKRKTLI